MQTIRRWFVYGLSALYQYWMRCCYNVLWFLIFISQSMQSYDEVKRFDIYLWMSVVCCHVRLSSRSKMKIII
jgi:hypothetical protein